MEMFIYYRMLLPFYKEKKCHISYIITPPLCCGSDSQMSSNLSSGSGRTVLLSFCSKTKKKKEKKKSQWLKRKIHNKHVALCIYLVLIIDRNGCLEGSGSVLLLPYIYYDVPEFLFQHIWFFPFGWQTNVNKNLRAFTWIRLSECLKFASTALSFDALEEVSREREVWTSLLGLLPPQPGHR